MKWKNEYRTQKQLFDSSPAVDNWQDVWTLVSWRQNDASLSWRIVSIIVIEAVQAINAVGDVWDVVALKQHLWHHLPTVQWVTGRLCQHDGLFHTALKNELIDHLSLCVKQKWSSIKYMVNRETSLTSD